jgi:hypothetical protein
MLWPKSPLAQIAGLSVGMAVLQPVAAIGAANRSFPVPILLFTIVGYALPVTMAIWVAADLRSRGHTPCFELPFLLLLAWPLSLLWYCIWTRGWRGLLLWMGLVALTFLPATLVDLARFAWMIVAS